MKAIDELEPKRFELQAQLDAGKTQAERNRLGQFATPPALAADILTYAKTLLPEGEPVRFLDPAIGTGAFYSALLKTFPASRIEKAKGFEIDPHYGRPAARLWADTGLELELADFTRQAAASRFNLLICNPPYVRHHHLANGEKTSLQARTLQACGLKLGGLAGLYCHFLGLSHAWLEKEAVSGWLIPSEFMDVNYGQAVKHYLLEHVTLLHIHRFDPNDVQFADALVSSAVVWFRNAPPPKNHSVWFSFGGRLEAPALSKMIPAKALTHERKWTRFPASGVRQKSDVPTIADFFKIKRGLATGHNGYFILSAEELAERRLPEQCFRSILPSPRYIMTDEIQADAKGNPLIERRLFLLDPAYDEEEIRERFPTLWDYLEEGRAQKLHERYLCSHRARWYSQEDRPAPPIVCTYLGRGDAKSGRPFRFILNHSKATVANVYLAMYPAPVLSRALARDSGLIRRVWEVLNRITPDRLLGEGRVYGGGLHKLEPKELANVPVPDIAELFPKEYLPVGQQEMFEELAAE
jgi:hypothetical protein